MSDRPARVLAPPIAAMTPDHASMTGTNSAHDGRTRIAAPLAAPTPRAIVRARRASLPAAGSRSEDGHAPERRQHQGHEHGLREHQ